MRGKAAEAAEERTEYSDEVALLCELPIQSTYNAVKRHVSISQYLGVSSAEQSCRQRWSGGLVVTAAPGHCIAIAIVQICRR